MSRKRPHYGYRYGTPKNPDTEGWGSLPPYDVPEKGNGFYGMLDRTDTPDTRSSEYSIGVTVDGKNYHVPSMVPGLTGSELRGILRGEISPGVVDKATNWARMRIGKGMPVFATPEEEGRSKTVPDKTDYNFVGQMLKNFA